MSALADEALAADREGHVLAILGSAGPRKVLIGGPGTGKSYVYKRLLSGVEEPKLVLTFIRGLAEGIQRDLGGIAQVNTFHGFCKYLLHKHGAPGLTSNVTYYPPLTEITALDVEVLDDEYVTGEELQNAFQGLDDSSGLLTRAIRSGDYYDAVGHADAVYRVFRYLSENSEQIPLFNQIVVDEYQDFSQLEVQFIELLAKRSPTLVAGDDDQALYGWRLASPDFLRALAARSDVELFQLPYCSRCTEAIVEAVGRILSQAQGYGLLTKRIAKRFECYLPDKREDSERYPNILHAECSVERQNTPYMGKYIERKIREISDEEISVSQALGRPPFLIIGPGHVVRPIIEYLSGRFEGVVMRKADPLQVKLLDGYTLLKGDEHSRLGWRILCHIDRPDSFDDIIRQALGSGAELRALLQTEYCDRHLRLVDLLARFERGETLPPTELGDLLSTTGQTVDEIAETLKLGLEFEGVSSASATPLVLGTTLMGAKGLEGEHVFIVGVNERNFPTEVVPTELEVCEFIVAVTRARKAVHVISARNWAGQWMKPGIFIEWLGDLVSKVVVNKDYFGSE